MYERRRMLLGSKKPLWIYKSGDSSFQNCTYSLTQYVDYLDFPPTVLGGEQLTDAALYRYYSNEELSPSSVSWLHLRVTGGFKGYKKLFVEARANTAYGGNLNASYIGVYYESEGRQTLTTTRTLYEIDLTNYQDKDGIMFYQRTENYMYIYNIWLE